MAHRSGSLCAFAPAAALLALAAAGCHLNLADAFDETNPSADIAGEWAFKATQCCSSSGSSWVVVEGSLFLSTSGGLSGSAALDGDSAMLTSRDLQVSYKNGAEFGFRLGLCSVSGTVYGSAGDYLAGSYDCGAGNGGSWSARRPTPPLSFAFPLTARTLVVGGAFVPKVIVTDAARRTLGRNLSLSTSNPAVATVDSLGLVRAVGAGTATITATHPDISGAVAVTSIGPVRFSAVAAGGAYTCGVTTDGTALCWGLGGGLGDSSSVGSSSPIGVAGALSWSALSTHANRTCGLTSAGAAYCWGTAPTAVPGARTFSAIAAGEGHACGLTTAGALFCWGWNYSGQLGNGSRNDSPEPSEVIGGLTFMSVSAGDSHTCAVAADSTAWCWGSNSAGQLGSNGQDTARARPVAGGLRFTAVRAGSQFTCGLTPAGRAYCWGANSWGQLGTGTLYDHDFVPSPVVGGLVFASLSASDLGVCGLTPSGKAYCWGLMPSGTDPYLASATPVAVAGGLTFAAVSAGTLHTCALATDGIVYCWGRNYSGELGDGTIRFRADPVRVVGQR